MRKIKAKNKQLSEFHVSPKDLRPHEEYINELTPAERQEFAEGMKIGLGRLRRHLEELRAMFPEQSSVLEDALKKLDKLTVAGVFEGTNSAMDALGAAVAQKVTVIAACAHFSGGAKDILAHPPKK